MINLYQFIPEIFILSLILITLCFGLFNKDRAISLNTLGFIFLSILLLNYGKDIYSSTQISLNTINLFVLSKIILSIGSIVFILLLKRPLKNENLYRYEYVLFLLFAILGSFVLISSNNFLTAFIGLELQSLSLYLMAAFNTKNLSSNEAGIKYFSLGALSSGFLLFGISMILIPEKKSKPLKDFFDSLNEVILKIIDLIMSFAPYGVFALLATLIVEAPKWDLLKSLLLYSITLLAGLFLLVVIYTIAVKLILNKSPNFFFKGILPAQLVAFSTSSSAATLPVTMDRVHNNLNVKNQWPQS